MGPSINCNKRRVVIGYRVGFFFSLGHSTIVVIAWLIVFASASKASTGRNLQAVAKITISSRCGVAAVRSAPLARQ